MIWRIVCLAACLVVLVANAHAQQGFRVFGPEGVPLTVRPGPDETVESVTAQLSRALAIFDNTGIDVREGVVREGEIFATRALPYENAARLANDVTRAGALSGRVLLLPAGTPLYMHEFISGDAVLFNGSARVRGMWCGAHEGRGYCLIERRNGWESAQIHSGSLYAPSALGPFVPADAPQLTSESSVWRELPERVEVYRLKTMRGSRATIARFVRAGADEVEVEGVQPRRLRLGSIMVRLAAGPEPASAIVRAEPLDPADHQTELRALARGILDVRGRRP